MPIRPPMVRSIARSIWVRPHDSNRGVTGPPSHSPNGSGATRRRAVRDPTKRRRAGPSSGGPGAGRPRRQRSPSDVDRRAIDGLDPPDEVRHSPGGDRVDRADRLASEPVPGRSDLPSSDAASPDTSRSPRPVTALTIVALRPPVRGSAPKATLAASAGPCAGRGRPSGRRCRRLAMTIGRDPIAPAARADQLDRGDDGIDSVHAEDCLVHSGE